MVDSAINSVAVSDRSWLALAAGAGVSAGLGVALWTPVVAVALFTGLIAAALILTVPELGLLILVFSTYLRGTETEFLAVLVLAIVLRWAARGEAPEGWLKPALLLGAYGAVGLASLLVAREPQVTQAGLLILGREGLAAVIIVVLLKRPESLRRVAWSMILAGALVASVSVHQRLTGSWDSTYLGLAKTPGIHHHDFRVAGTIGDPNFYGLVLLLLVPLAVDRLRAEESLRLRAVALGALCAVLLALLFTLSRGALVGLLTTLALMAVLWRPRPAHLLAVLGLAVMLSPLVPTSLLERVSAVPQSLLGISQRSAVRDRALQGRFSENLVAVQMFADHPILGVGYANYPVRYQEYSQSVGLDPRREQRAPHNLFLGIAAETGILGLAAFAVLLWFVFRAVVDARRMNLRRGAGDSAGLTEAIGIGLAGFLTSSLFLDLSFPRFFFMFVGIALALPRIASARPMRAISADLVAAPPAGSPSMLRGS